MSHLQLSLMNRLNKTESTVFKLWMLYFPTCAVTDQLPYMQKWLTTELIDSLSAQSTGNNNSTIYLYCFVKSCNPWSTITSHSEGSVKSTGSQNAITVNFLNIRTPKIFAVITLKVEQDGVSLE